MWRYISTDELYHYGIKGMRWGVRRYQNADGSLTPAGKKRISKQYKKLQSKVDRDYQKVSRKIYIDSYNRAADKMNSGEIDRFNKQQEKKYGKDFAERSGYEQDYFKMFNKELEKQMNMSVKEFYSTNTNYKKAEELVKKYEMTKWDDLAKRNFQ